MGSEKMESPGAPFMLCSKCGVCWPTPDPQRRKCYVGATKKSQMGEKQNKNKNKSETKMTASVLKQDPNTQKIQKNAYLLGYKHIICKFSG